MTRSRPRLRRFIPAVLALLALLACTVGAAAQANYPGNIQIWDTKTNTQVGPSGDNFGQGTAGATYTNQRVLWFADLLDVNLDVHDCTIPAPWSLIGPPGLGSDVTILPGLHNDLQIDLEAAQYGYYTATVSCQGTGGFSFPVTWQLLNTTPTISVAVGSQGIAPNSTYNFPTTLAGTTAGVTFTITNFGQAALIVSNTAVTGTGFSLGSTPLQSIAAGMSSSFTVNFSPTSGSLYSGSLTINSNDAAGNSKLKINLTGTGTAATPTLEIADYSNGGASVNPGSTVSYGSPAAGTTVTHNFHITNNGNVALTISNPSSIVSGTGYSLPVPPPATINANGGTGSFSVSFVESSSGTYPGQVSILSNASPSPFNFTIAATVPSTPSGVAVYGPTGVQIANGGFYNTGGILIGNTQLIILQVSNLSPTSNVEISNVNLDGSSEFTIYRTNTGSLGPSQSVQEIVQFIPTSTANVNTTLSFTAGSTPWTIELLGYGITPQPAMSLDWNATGAAIQNGQTYPFSSTTAGTPVSELFNVFNNGSATLTISSVTVSSPAGCFTLITTPASSLAAGSSTSGRVRLFSTTPVACTGTVTITSNDPTNPTFTFNLTGTVTTVPYSLAIVAGDGTAIPPGGTYAFPSTTVGVAVSRGFTITNNGTAAITISNASSILSTSGGFSVQLVPTTPVTGSGGTSAFRIRLQDGTSGSYTGTVTIDGDPAGPYTFTITGTVD